SLLGLTWSGQRLIASIASEGFSATCPSASMIRISPELTLAPRRPVLHDADVTTQRLTADQRNSFVAALLGWTMDAFDYFIVVLVYADIAKTFHISKAEVAFVTTATLL